MQSLSQQLINQQFIDNQWVPSAGTRLLDVMNPYREVRIAQVTAGDAADGDAIDRLGAAIFERWGALDGLLANAGRQRAGKIP